MKILGSVVLAFLLIGCSDSAKEEVQKVEATQVVKDVVQDSKKAVEEVKAQAAEAKVVVEPKVAEAKAEVTEVVEKVAEEVKVEAEEAQTEVTEDIEKAVEEVKADATEAVVEPKVEVTEVVEKAVEEIKAEAAKDISAVENKVVEAQAEANKMIAEAKPSLDSGKAIFTVCAGCHGMSGEKAALGKSQIIKGWSVAQVSDALNGYKAGTYGGVMQGVMKGQASKLSDDDIKAVADYISSL